MGGIIQLELKRNTNKIILIIFAVFILSALTIYQVGISKYLHEKGKITEFLKTEKTKIERYLNYTQYGLYGYRVLLIPSPLSALFYNSTTISEIEAFVDSGVRLKFSEPKVGEDIFESPTGGSLDFSWYLLTIGGLLTLVFGFFTFRNTDYIKFLQDYSGKAKVKFSFIFARIILVSAATAILQALAYIQLRLNGLKLSQIESHNYLIFSLVITGVMIFLMLIGAFIGKVKHPAKGAIILGLFWLLAVFLYPEVINIVIKNKAASIKSRYRHEIEKVVILMKFEKDAFKNSQRYKTKEEKLKAEAELAESFYDKELKRVEALESQMVIEMSRLADLHQILCSINPITFYKTIGNEVSSKGFNAYFDFYGYCRKSRVGFSRYYINKKYYSNYSKVEPFIEKGENLYYSKSSLPEKLLPGFWVLLIYIAILLLGLFRFNGKKSQKNIEREPQIDFKGQKTVFVLCRPDIRGEIFRYYVPKDNVACIDKVNARDFRIGLKSNAMFRHFCRIAGVEKSMATEYLKLMGIENFNESIPSCEEILKIYVSIKAASENDIVVFNDFMKNESRLFEENIFCLWPALEDAGKKIIYLGDEMPYPKTTLTDEIKLDNFAVFPLPFEKVTLR